MLSSRWLRVVGALAALLTVLAVFLTATATEPAPGPFADTWARTDLPVQSGEENRTWIWAPEAFTEVLQEPYTESPGGMRDVQYFDKSRMEITDPAADPNTPWYVTNGLLVLEMVEGYIQTGNNDSIPHSPSTLPIAGDLDGGESSPQYAGVAEFMDMEPAEEGATVLRRWNPDGTFSDDPSLAVHGVTEGPSAAEYGRNHRSASVFWAFMTSSGTIWDGENFVIDQLFENSYYATGLPVAPPFWATVNVGGTPKDVLIQCFERRCLTYTPDNPPGWQVEAGNVGLAYYAWRYAAEEDPTPTVPVAPTQSGSSTPAEPTSTGEEQPGATSTATAGATGSPSPTEAEPTAPATNTAIPTNTATATTPPTVTSEPSPTMTTMPDTGPIASCLNATESAFLTLINQHRASNELGPLSVSSALNVAAYNHSLDMSANNYFSHFSQNGDSPADRMIAAGYTASGTMGENIAQGPSTAQGAFNLWLNSPDHNANMLSPDFNAIGIGYVSDGNYWTTTFGGVADAPPSC